MSRTAFWEWDDGIRDCRGQSHYIFNDTIDKYMLQFNRLQAHWRSPAEWVGYRMPREAANHFIQTNIDNEAWHGISFYHHSRINLEETRMIDGKNTFEFEEVCDVGIGYDGGPAANKPSAYTASLSGILMLGVYSLSFFASRYNALQILTSYKSDHSEEGRHIVALQCNNLGRLGHFEGYSEQKGCYYTIPYRGFAVGDGMASNSCINRAVTCGSNYGVLAIQILNGKRLGIHRRHEFTPELHRNFRYPGHPDVTPGAYNEDLHVWTLIDPVHGQQMGRQTEDAFKGICKDIDPLNQFDFKESESIRTYLCTDKFNHGIKGIGHKLSWVIMDEFDHPRWNIIRILLQQDVILKNNVAGLSIEEATQLAEAPFVKVPSFVRQLKTFWSSKKNSDGVRICQFRFTGNMINHLAIGYPSWLLNYDRLLLNKYDNIIDAEYQMDCFTIAKFFVTSCLVFELTGNLKMGRYPKKDKDGNDINIPPICLRNIAIAHQLFFIWHELMPYMLCPTAYKVTWTLMYIQIQFWRDSNVGNMPAAFGSQSIENIGVQMNKLMHCNFGTGKVSQLQYINNVKTAATEGAIQHGMVDYMALFNKWDSPQQLCTVTDATKHEWARIENQMSETTRKWIRLVREFKYGQPNEEIRHFINTERETKINKILEEHMRDSANKNTRYRKLPKRYQKPDKEDDDDDEDDDNDDDFGDNYIIEEDIDDNGAVADDECLSGLVIHENTTLRSAMARKRNNRA